MKRSERSYTAILLIIGMFTGAFYASYLFISKKEEDIIVIASAAYIDISSSGWSKAVFERYVVKELAEKAQKEDLFAGFQKFSGLGHFNKFGKRQIEFSVNEILLAGVVDFENDHAATTKILLLRQNGQWLIEKFLINSDVIK